MTTTMTASMAPTLPPTMHYRLDSSPRALTFDDWSKIVNSVVHEALELMQHDRNCRPQLRSGDDRFTKIATDLFQRVQALHDDDESVAKVLKVLAPIVTMHRPSRALFSNRDNMKLLLDLVRREDCPSVQAQSVAVLLGALLDSPTNMCLFESMDGLAITRDVFAKAADEGVTIQILAMWRLYRWCEPADTFPSADKSIAKKSIAEKMMFGEEPAWPHVDHLIERLDRLMSR